MGSAQLPAAHGAAAGSTERLRNPPPLPTTCLITGLTEFRLLAV